MQPELVIYTDGACSPNPGPGGWGAVILREGLVVRELSGRDAQATNNRMELTAALAALRALEEPSRVTVCTDSSYLKNGITDWISTWRRNGWRTAGKTEVKNADLWRQLLAEMGRHTVDWRWVRGHAADRWNIRADELAVAARKKGGGRTESRPGEPVLDRVHLYTGVTCRHAAGVGGWAVVMSWRRHVRIIGSGTIGMTANQLYLRALSDGLASLKQPLPVLVHTYSGYLYDGATGWLGGWKKRGWRTRDGAPVSNRELWRELAELLDTHEVSFVLEDRERPRCFMQEAKELAREFEQG